MRILLVLDIKKVKLYKVKWLTKGTNKVAFFFKKNSEYIDGEGRRASLTAAKMKLNKSRKLARPLHRLAKPNRCWDDLSFQQKHEREAFPFFLLPFPLLFPLHSPSRPYVEGTRRILRAISYYYYYFAAAANKS